MLGCGTSSSTFPAQCMVVWLGSLGSRALAGVARSGGYQHAKPAADLDEYDLANFPCLASVVLALESPNSQSGGCPFCVSTCDACECDIGIRGQHRHFCKGSSSVFGNRHLYVELQRPFSLRGGTRSHSKKVLSEIKTPKNCGRTQR